MKIFRQLIVIVFLISALIPKAQNQGYQILHDSIQPIIETDYPRAKTLILKYESIIDPQELLLLLDEILSQGDIDFFKDRTQYLMINYGLNYSEIDLVESRLIPANLQAQISKIHLTQWMFEESSKHYSNWIKENSKSLWLRKKVYALKTADQTIRRFPSISEDSICDELIHQQQVEIDFENLQSLAELCQINDGKMLNHFDNGLQIYYRAFGIIIWHNLNNEINFQKSWDLILPYVEAAYFEEKIDFTIFKMYDLCCKKHNDYQYYGTLDNSIPIHDLENYKQRREKYHLGDFSLKP